MPKKQATLLVLLLPNHVQAGFPSAAEDLGAHRVDLAQLLITAVIGIAELFRST